MDKEFDITKGNPFRGITEEQKQKHMDDFLRNMDNDFLKCFEAILNPNIKK